MLNLPSGISLPCFRAALVAALACTALPAVADEIRVEGNVDWVFRVVSVRNLNLTEPADRAVLKHRINVAAYKVCNDVGNAQGLASDSFTTCVRTSLKDANRQVQPLIAMAIRRSELASR
jgi:UrcA family protein